MIFLATFILDSISSLQREAALEVRKKFVSHEGDHITLLNIYRAYKAAKGNKVPIELRFERLCQQFCAGVEVLLGL